MAQTLFSAALPKKTARDIFVIKLVTLLSCSSCIGCWLMEDTIMAPILNFYGTFPGDEKDETKENGKLHSRLNYSDEKCFRRYFLVRA